MQANGAVGNAAAVQAGALRALREVTLAAAAGDKGKKSGGGKEAAALVVVRPASPASTHRL